ncbi:stringent starvation protein B [Nitrosomonas sp. PY1]|uniref:ClpXP protease specificity-enhancing factor n=1 Tax=Nitrosomonas sp. PY1 TaxID=1803906 RepID=UPI001FC83622|nr:ClpXP protease specificity-enhancing factor [Nitrosomonas sp. PY1]GKS70015.1 stringent starvation protein B [Nitrosomonas sp. PY1]
MKLKNSSNKPYLIRSIYEWCVDNSFTPYISVIVFPELDMPGKYFNNDEIIFNISNKAVNDLIIDNEFIYFSARFNGVSRELEIPMTAIKGIFAKETNQGILFSLDADNENRLPVTEDTGLTSIANSSGSTSKRNHLRIVK